MQVAFAELERKSGDDSTTATLISLVPFTLDLLVYALVIDSGKGGEPETAIVRNPTLMALSALWAVSLVAVLYL
jgi:hypothetical protein